MRREFSEGRESRHKIVHRRRRIKLRFPGCRRELEIPVDGNGWKKESGEETGSEPKKKARRERERLTKIDISRKMVKKEETVI